MKQVLSINDILDFCNMHKKIICYGAGKYGRIVRYFLYENNIEVFSFAETNIVYDRIVLGLKVENIENACNSKEDIGIIVCSNSNIRSEMVNVLNSLHVNNYFVPDDDLICILDMYNKYLERFEEPGRKHILLYHRVCDLKDDIWNMSVSPAMFDKHMKYVKDNYDIVRVKDIDFEDGREQLAITFDDGYYDIYRNALPILEKYEVPATLYVTTGNIDTPNEFWWDQIQKCFFDNEYCPDSIELFGEVFDLSTREKRELVCWGIREICLKLDWKDRENTLAHIKTVTHDDGESRTQYRSLSSEELVKLDKSVYMDIGGHTVTHCRLSSLDVARVKEEIINSKKEIEKKLSHEITTFSFPFGGEVDYNMTSIECTIQVGYSKVLAVKTRFYENELCDYNYGRIPIEVNGDDPEREIRRMLALS